MRRRDFVWNGIGAAAALALPLEMQRARGRLGGAADGKTRWRGFNLLEMFDERTPAGPFRESDFQAMAEWGFNFARIPMSYWHWSRPNPQQWLTIDEKPFEFVDGVIRLGESYRVHINLNLHRIPGYCINNRQLEPLDLFAGDPSSRARALEAASHHWRFIAHRYRGIPSTRLSFDLINEPPSHLPPGDYVKVISSIVAAIRKEDPHRLIIADGLDAGRTPVPALARLGLMQSTRGYDPVDVTQYRATWIPGRTRESWRPPSWPMEVNGVRWDRTTIHDRLIVPWKALEARHVKVHVGEWGCYSFTPHDVVIAWMRDMLELWEDAGWGWALWNLRGPFGVLESGRADVSYQDYHGLKLDAAMLELLRAH